MKTCGEYEERISAYLDGELSKDGQAELMEHMASCPVCQQYFNDLVEIHAAMIPEEAAVPEDFSERVMKRVRAAEQERPQAAKAIRLPRWKRWTALAACCAAAALGLFTLQRAGSDPASLQASVASYAAADETGGAPAAFDGGSVPEAQSDRPQPRPSDAGAADGAAYDGSGAPAGMPAAQDAEGEACVTEDSIPLNAPQAPEKAAATGGRADGPEELPAGTVAAGGERVRQWVEETLGLEWEAGRLYPLEAEEYAGLLAVLAEAGADFTQEPGEGYWLLAAQPPEGF